MSITLYPQREAEVISHVDSGCFADPMDVLTGVPHVLEKIEQWFADLNRSTKHFAEVYHVKYIVARWRC